VIKKTRAVIPEINKQAGFRYRKALFMNVYLKRIKNNIKKEKSDLLSVIGLR